MAKLKLTADLTERIAKLIEEGNYNHVAARAVGIGESTFYSWLDKGKKGQGRIYVEFLEAIKKAEAVGETKHIGVIKDAANSGTWQASAWILERKYPDRWGKRDKMDVTSNGETIVVTLKNGKDDS